jgi:non-ribosomal peptide synthetase component F
MLNVSLRLAQANDRVGICTGETMASCIALWGTWASGRSAVPLGIRSPPARLGSIHDQAQFDTVLMDQSMPPEIVDHWLSAGVDLVDLDATLATAPRSACSSTPAFETSARLDAEAYVIFTSGSTGTPKGVRIAQASLLAYSDHIIASTGLRPGARLSSNFAQTFDPSLYDRVAGLLAGATTVVPLGREALHPVNYVRSRRLTHWYSVPSIIRVADRMNLLPPGVMPTLEYSAFVGEPLLQTDAEVWGAAAPASRVVNAYGPTEITVTCSEFEHSRSSEHVSPNGTVPVGAIYPHFEWAMVTPERTLSGSQGELVLRGVQRLISYVDDDDNDGRFFEIDEGVVSDPEPGDADPSLWYRTGDLVRVIPSSAATDRGETRPILLHLGRIDRQVKIRGFRLELAEVESALRGVADVSESAVVVTVRGGFDSLTGFVTGPPWLHGQRVRESLRALLPAYMVPDMVVVLDQLPLTDRGKVDRQSLVARAESRG